MVETTITKVGNSHYILIPSFIVESFKLKNGDRVEMEILKDSVTIKIERKKQ